MTVTKVAPVPSKSKRVETKPVNVIEQEFPKPGITNAVAVKEKGVVVTFVRVVKMQIPMKLISCVEADKRTPKKKKQIKKVNDKKTMDKLSEAYNVSTKQLSEDDVPEQGPTRSHMP